MQQVIIIGSGLAGLSAALHLAEHNITSLMVSPMMSERSQSVMAEGGINGALNTMGQDDSPAVHAADTYKAGRFLSDENAIRDMTEAAPALLRKLHAAGLCFDLNAEGDIALRPFGGQSKKRTAHAASNTGKQLMHTLISMVRKYEESGMVQRLTGWEFVRILKQNGHTTGCCLKNCSTGSMATYPAQAVIIASGGLNGLFGNATGSVMNRGDVTASLFADGVELANAEMVQYHPTTVRLHAKNMLITEAVRGEGGRLFAVKQPEDEPYYFMEDRFPEQKNLAPRDVISREEWKLQQEGYSIYLDMRHMDPELIARKLPGVAKDCREYLGIDVTKEPIPIEPGIHYFMGGIRVDRAHHTSLSGLYAAGECCCQYHGANRLGGNSLLGALYGGKRAADSVAQDLAAGLLPVPEKTEPADAEDITDITLSKADTTALQSVMRRTMGIARTADTLETGYAELEKLYESCKAPLCLLGMALVQSAMERKECRGAQYRLDYPGEQDEFHKTTVASYGNGTIHISFAEIG